LGVDQKHCGLTSEALGIVDHGKMVAGSQRWKLKLRVASGRDSELAIIVIALHERMPSDKLAGLRHLFSGFQRAESGGPSIPTMRASGDAQNPLRGGRETSAVVFGLPARRFI
jgi:hypothetical protein